MAHPSDLMLGTRKTTIKERRLAFSGIMIFIKPGSYVLIPYSLVQGVYEILLVKVKRQLEFSKVLDILIPHPGILSKVLHLTKFA